MDASDYVDLEAIRYRIDAATPDLNRIDWQSFSNTEIVTAVVHGQLLTLAAFLSSEEFPWFAIGSSEEARQRIAEGLRIVAAELVEKEGT